MKSLLVGMQAETFLHPGSGQNDGAIDLPIARERSTDYPVIYGSMLKGALRARNWHAMTDQQKENESSEAISEYFGRPEENSKAASAGGILVGDARLLLLPVRSLSASFKWVICPLIIQRFMRDLVRAGAAIDFQIPVVNSQAYLSISEENSQTKSDKTSEDIFLEEWLFKKQTTEGLNFDPLIQAIEKMMPELVKDGLKKRLVIVNDEDFAVLVRQGTPVNARNQLNKETKSSENLWYEEVLSPDTLFYSLFLPRFDAELLQRFAKSEISDKPYLQIGGNETVGQGWVNLTPFHTIANSNATSTEAAA